MILQYFFNSEETIYAYFVIPNVYYLKNINTILGRIRH